MLIIINHQDNANKNQNEIPLYTHCDGYSQKHLTITSVGEIWSGWNIHRLLVLMEINIITVENSLEISQVIKYRVTL